MLRPFDLIAVVLLIVAVTWLNVPRLLLPAFVVTLGGLSIYRWHREGREPAAAVRYRSQLIASTILIVGISIPLILRLVPPNGIYGFRTPMTRSNPAIWYTANAFMGWTLLVAAGIAAAMLWWLPEKANRGVLLAVFLIPILSAVLASFIYLQRLLT